MGENKDLKIHALIPSDIQSEKDVLEKALKDLGSSVETYDSLPHFRELISKLKTLGPDTLALLFTDIRSSSKTSGQENPDPVGFPSPKQDPMLKIMASEALQDEFLEEFPTQRNRLQMIAMLNRDCDPKLIEQIPEGVHYLGRPLTESETYYHLRYWLNNFKVAVESVREPVLETLAPPAPLQNPPKTDPESDTPDLDITFVEEPTPAPPEVILKLERLPLQIDPEADSDSDSPSALLASRYEAGLASRPSPSKPQAPLYPPKFRIVPKGTPKDRAFSAVLRQFRNFTLPGSPTANAKVEASQGDICEISDLPPQPTPQTLAEPQAPASSDLLDDFEKELDALSSPSAGADSEPNKRLRTVVEEFLRRAEKMDPDHFKEALKRIMDQLAIIASETTPVAASGGALESPADTLRDPVYPVDPDHYAETRMPEPEEPAQYPSESLVKFHENVILREELERTRTMMKMAQDNVKLEQEKVKLEREKARDLVRQRAKDDAKKEDADASRRKLRDEDREIAIRQIASTYQHFLYTQDRIKLKSSRNLTIFGEEAFYKFSKPADFFDSKSGRLFRGNDPKHEMAPSDDYKIDRTLPEINTMLGVDDVVAIKNIAHRSILDYFKSQGIKNAGNKIKTVHVGPGKCSIMDEFPKAERALNPNLVSSHVGFGRAILHHFSDLLAKIMVPNPESVPNPNSKDGSGFSRDSLLRFATHLNSLLLKYKGRDGRYKIRLGPSADQTRLQGHVLELAENDEVQKIARGEQEGIEGTTGRYAKDKMVPLTEEDQQCIDAFHQDPEGFFNRYFPGFFSENTPEELQKVFGLESRYDMIYDEFQKAQQIFKDSGQFAGFVLDVKAASHLEDPQFLQFVHEMAAHLIPGGIYLGNSHEESYTWQIRVDELRAISEKLGKEYAIYLICDDHRPHSFILLRGVPHPTEKDKYAFPLEAIHSQLKNSKTKLVRLDKFEYFMPEVAFRNKVIWQTKYGFLVRYHAGLPDNKYRIEVTQTWRNACYDKIDEKITELLNAYTNPKSSHWRAVRDRIQARGKKFSRKSETTLFFHRMVPGSDLEDFLNFVREKHNFDLNSFIESILEKHLSAEDK